MSVGLGFTNIPKITGHMAYLFEKGMLGLETHGPEVDYRTQCPDGTSIMNHEMVFGLQVSVRVEL